MSSLTEHLSPRTNQWRRLKDRIATVSVTAGGAGVLFAILLIFFYLLYEVVPLFKGASIEPREPVATAECVRYRSRRDWRAWALVTQMAMTVG